VDKISSYFYIDLKIWEINRYHVHLLDNLRLISMYCDRMWWGKESQTKSKLGFYPNPDLRIMDRVREVLGYQHWAYRTG